MGTQRRHTNEKQGKHTDTRIMHTETQMRHIGTHGKTTNAHWNTN